MKNIAKTRGRKPKLEKDRQSITLTFRVTPELHHILTMEAKRRKVSIGTFIKSRLEGLIDAKREAKFASQTVNALASAVRHIALNTEMQTGKSWSVDRFTFDTLVLALGRFFQTFTPKGKRIIPKFAWQKDKNIPNEVLKTLQKTCSVEALSSMVADGFLQQLYMTEYPNNKDSQYSEEYHDLPQIRSILQKKST